MDLDRIDYFLTLAELENFTEAAKACHIAQTTMSKYISSLEQGLGFKLFERTRQKTHLTSEGQMLYEGMKKIRQEYQALLSDIKQHRTLTLGIMMKDFMTIPILQTYTLESDVHLRFVFDATLSDLSSRQIDALIMPDIYPLKEKLCSLTLRSCQEALVFPPNCQDVRTAIQSLPLITKAFDEAYIATCRQRLYDVYGVTFKDSQSVMTIQELLMLVSIGQGFAIIPQDVAEQHTDVNIIALDALFNERIVLVYHQDNNRITGLLDFLMKKSAEF